MAQRIWCCLPVLASLLLTVGCVPNKIYRPGEMAVQTAPTLPDTGASAHFKLGILEFDDMGESWEKCTSLQDPNNCQLTRVLELIQSEKRSGHDVVVVMFTHGWKNNASPNNEAKKNLRDFKLLLETLTKGEAQRAAKLAASSGEATKPRTYIGVYMGWRGQSLAGDLALTFYNRRDTAQHVGSSDYAEAVYRIMAATKLDSKNSRIVVVGHSFGGRALETAITNTFVSLLIPQPTPDGVSTSPELRSPADLILYVNPATDSFRTKQMIELMKRTSFAVNRGTSHPEGPLFLSITSTGDSATGTAFPLGQDLSALRKSFRPGYNEAPLAPSQKTFFTHTPGHLPYLYSHSVLPFSGSCVSAGAALRFTADSKCYEMKPIEHAWNDSPFWVSTVPTTIIPDHATIFTSAFAQMITQLIDYYNVLDSPRATTMSRTQ
jgi:hypothetical protein